MSFLYEAQPLSIPCWSFLSFSRFTSLSKCVLFFSLPHVLHRQNCFFHFGCLFLLAFKRPAKPDKVSLTFFLETSLVSPHIPICYIKTTTVQFVYYSQFFLGFSGHYNLHWSPLICRKSFDFYVSLSPTIILS